MHHNTDILIVGGGAFGTSTAYHLAQRGYTSVRVLDRYAAPSLEAASTDISKIIRSDYNDPLYAAMGVESISAWRSWDILRDLYYVTGWILSAAHRSIPFVEGSIETCERLGVTGLERMTPDQIRRRFPLITGELDAWNVNVWNPTAGWAKSGEALGRMALAAQEKGVQYISGEGGYVRKMVYEGDRCTGVITEDGTTHNADMVIMAAGAWTPSLVDLNGQLTAKGHAVAHIQLTPEETQRYQTLPILDNLEHGYFLPAQEDGIFKLAHSQFVTNEATDPRSGITTSIPHTFGDNPEDDIPMEIEQTMRRNLRRVLPELADRPFCYTRLCWDADTVDRDFLVTPHPVLQVLGKYIVDLLEGCLDPAIVHQWRWRPDTASSKNLAHADPDMELKELSGWRGRKFHKSGKL
ncbi:FAD dependent oxidoreductase [Aspergillus avenaceus]|uniref:FAD dependent oxidoreductase n=1 Tax=Aspergillus avenaceus TaxID=36643 RepID=A0A5N6TLX1_ASPAV|nr:FAD dependent oxidoreductase [Aspergillus avenaceus]